MPRPKHYRRTFWRPVGRVWHAFSGYRNSLYHSLCNPRISKAGSSGERVNRPPAVMRCARCDIAEMKRYGVEQSLDETAGWEANHER